MKQKNKSICDRLCTPLAKKLSPYCLLCGHPTEVGHHYVHKSKSLALRYDPENIIGLCNSCHFALHNNESFYGGKIRQIKGEKWFLYLESKKPLITRYMDYNQVYVNLKNLIG